MGNTLIGLNGVNASLKRMEVGHNHELDLALPHLPPIWEMTAMVLLWRLTLTSVLQV